MSTEGIQSTWRCPECGRENRVADVRCWLCFAPRPGAAAVADRPPPLCRPLGDDRDDDYPQLPRTASLFQRRLPIATAVLIILLMLATLALMVLVFDPLGNAVEFVVTALLGLAVLLILTPALVRLFRVGRARAAEPPPESRNLALQNFRVIIAAPLIAMLVVGSAFITFVAVCAPVTMTGYVGMGEMGHSGWSCSRYCRRLGVRPPPACGVGYLVVFLFFRPTPRFCPRCGVKNPRAATACRFCGAAMPSLTGPNGVQGR